MSEEEDFYRGWENTITGEGLNIGRVPFRKRYALYLSKPGMFNPVCYFRNREDAERTASVIASMINTRGLLP